MAYSTAYIMTATSMMKPAFVKRVCCSNLVPGYETTKSRLIIFEKHKICIPITPYPPNIPVIKRLLLVDSFISMCWRNQSRNIAEKPKKQHKKAVPNTKWLITAHTYPIKTPVHLAQTGNWYPLISATCFPHFLQYIFASTSSKFKAVTALHNNYNTKRCFCQHQTVFFIYNYCI